jgi:hypothetical protein
MRRLCLLFALVGLMSAILAGAGGAADARALRRKVKGKTRAHPAAATAVHAPTRRKRAARTQDAESAGTPTSPDVVPRRLMIVGFDGRGAQVARAAAADALRTIASVRVLPLAPAEAMRLGTAYGAEKTVGLAQHLNLTAVLFGKITQARRDVRLSMQLANGEDGRVVGEMNFQARSVGALRTKVRAQLWSKLSPLIDRAASPGPPATIVSEGELPIDRPRELPAEPPVPEAEPPAKPPGAVAPLAAESDDEEAPAPAGTGAGGGKPRPHAGGPTGVGAADGEAEHEIEAVVEDRPATAPQRCPVAELSPGAGIMARRYNYRAEQIGALRGYSLYRAPVGRIDGTLYPFSGGGCRVGNGVGLRGSYEIMGPVTSQVGGRHLGTQASAYELDLVLRIVSGRLTVQPALGFLARQYHVDGQVVPSADYRAVGGGVDVALRGRILGFGIGAAGWGILHVGELESAAWFPRQSHFGVTARAQASVAVSPWIDIVAGATAQYETFTFTVDQGAANPNGIAGGAYDFYVQGTAGVRFRLGLTTAPRPRP